MPNLRAFPTWPIPPDPGEVLSLVAVERLLSPYPPRVEVEPGEVFPAPAERAVNFVMLGMARFDGEAPAWWLTPEATEALVAAIKGGPGHHVTEVA